MPSSIEPITTAPLRARARTERGPDAVPSVSSVSGSAGRRWVGTTPRLRRAASVNVDRSSSGNP
jgi:hypothetical protein